MDKQRSPKKAAVLVAGGCVLTGGISAAASNAHDNEWTCGDYGNALLPFLCITTIAVAAVRRWISQSETRTQAAIRAIAHGESRRLTEQLAQREAALTAREQLLRQTQADLAAERHQHNALKTDYREVTDAHNALVLQVLAEGAGRFAPRTGEPPRAPSPGSDHPRPRHAEHHRGPAPSLAVVRAREHQGTV